MSIASIFAAGLNAEVWRYFEVWLIKGYGVWGGDKPPSRENFWSFFVCEWYIYSAVLMHSACNSRM